jgi:hypothetical protein
MLELIMSHLVHNKGFKDDILKQRKKKKEKRKKKKEKKRLQTLALVSRIESPNDFHRLENKKSVIVV